VNREGGAVERPPVEERHRLQADLRLAQQPLGHTLADLAGPHDEGRREP
jgi:hypothetical protein